MKKKFRIIILSTKFVKLINRILIILNRRNINILYINISFINNYKMKCIFEIENFQECIDKVIQQIDKQIGVISTFYQEFDK